MHLLLVLLLLFIAIALVSFSILALCVTRATRPIEPDHGAGVQLKLLRGPARAKEGASKREERYSYGKATAFGTSDAAAGEARRIL
jgi:hypothetical protein